MERRDDNLKTFPNKEKKQQTDNSKEDSFFCNRKVRKCKNPVYKILCESAVTSAGLSNEQFYKKAEISRQQWYYWSWGIETFPDWLKIRLCDKFGKPFRDLFIQLQEVEK